MLDTFYIIKVTDSHYQLRIKGTYFCISSAGSLDRILLSLSNIIKRYKTRSRLLSAIHKIEDKFILNPEVIIIKQEKLFTEQGHIFNDYVKETINEALNEVKNIGNPLAKSLGKIKLIKSKVVAEEKKTIIEDVDNVKILVNKIPKIKTMARIKI